MTRVPSRSTWESGSANGGEPHAISIAIANRFNAGVNVNQRRFLGSASVNYTSKAFWTDVLSEPYHGYTDAFTMVNGTVGWKWLNGKLITSLKGTNLLNDDNSQGGIQQHIFGDIITRTVVGEVRYSF